VPVHRREVFDAIHRTETGDKSAERTNPAVQAAIHEPAAPPSFFPIEHYYYSDSRVDAHLRFIV